MYTCFARTWWKLNPAWPNGLEPCLGEKTIVEKYIETEEKAKAICKKWNSEHEPGRLSLKCEFEETSYLN